MSHIVLEGRRKTRISNVKQPTHEHVKPQYNLDILLENFLRSQVQGSITLLNIYFGFEISPSKPTAKLRHFSQTTKFIFYGKQKKPRPNGRGCSFS